MGQANLRGTKEERVDQAIKIKLEKIENERIDKQQWWESMTQEEKDNYFKDQDVKRKANLEVAQMLGMVMGGMTR